MIESYRESYVNNKYKEVILRVRNFTLHRRVDEPSILGGYLAMIGHNCRTREQYYLRNGEREPMCTYCGEYVPDEIWGLWQLLCNDQRQRATKSAKRSNR